MPVRKNCSGCGRALRVVDEFIGKRIKCPYCQEVQTVDGGEGPAPGRQPPVADGAAAGKRKHHNSLASSPLPSSLDDISFARQGKDQKAETIGERYDKWFDNVEHTQLCATDLVICAADPKARYTKLGSCIFASNGVFFFELADIELSELHYLEGEGVATLVRTIGYGLVGGLLTTLQYSSKRNSVLSEYRKNLEKLRGQSTIKGKCVSNPKPVIYFPYHEINRYMIECLVDSKTVCKGFSTPVATFVFSEPIEIENHSEAGKVFETVKSHAIPDFSWSLDKFLLYLSVSSTLVDTHGLLKYLSEKPIIEDNGLARFWTRVHYYADGGQSKIKTSDITSHLKLSGY